MTKRTKLFWTVNAIAVCFLSFLYCPIICAQEMDSAPSDTAAAASDKTVGTGGGDTDIGAVEEFTLSPVPESGQPGPGPVRFILNSRGEYQFNADIDDAGKFSVTRALAGIGLKSPLGQRFAVAVGAVYDFAGYDFNDSPAFGGGEPWDNINTGLFLIDVDYNINERWSLFGGGIGAIAAESGADVSDSFTGGGFLGAGYRPSGSLNIRLGVSVMSRLEDDVLVLPIFLADWAIDRNWQLRAGVLETGASDLIGVGLTYRINEQWSLGTRASYLNKRFRLDDSGFAPDGIGEDERFKGTLLVTWQPLPQLVVSALGGLVFAGDLRVEDENGNRLFKGDYDPAPFISARVALRF